MTSGIIFIILGAFTIFTGIKIIVTGNMSAIAERRIEELSEKAKRSYKLLNAVFNIISGLVLIGYSVISILKAQKIIPDSIVYPLVLLGVLVVLLSIYAIFWFRIKKDKKND